MFSEPFYEPSLWLIPLKLRKAYIHSTVFDAYAVGRCTRCVNNNTSVKNLTNVFSLSAGFNDYQPGCNHLKIIGSRMHLQP